MQSALPTAVLGHAEGHLPHATSGGALSEGLAASQLAVLTLSATLALAPAMNAATRTLGRAPVQTGRNIMIGSLAW